MTTTSSDYVDGVLKDFINRHQGQYLDHSHAYGPQAPDVIEYYVEALLGRPWQFRAGFAARLWDDPQADMVDFVKVQRDEPLRRGDILVFDGATSGTVGIYTAPGARVGSVQMLTQNPGPVQVIDIMADGYVHKLLGAWRLSYAAECEAMVTKFAQQLGYGADVKRDLAGKQVGDMVEYSDADGRPYLRMPADMKIRPVSVTRTDEELPPRKRIPDLTVVDLIASLKARFRGGKR